LVILTDLSSQLASLDADIAALRDTINPPGPPLREVDSAEQAASTSASKSTAYHGVTDPAKLTRLVKAKEKTKQLLESKAGWAGMNQSKAEDEAAQAAQARAT
jgi:hypothetical protein